MNYGFGHRQQSRLSDLEWTVSLAPSAGAAPLLWVIDELKEAWRSAQREAHDAHAGWSRSHRPDAYVAYRAAQDRADAAQDTFAGRLRVQP